jgi:hypothetical protein
LLLSLHHFFVIWGRVPKWRKRDKSFRGGVWGETLFQKGPPQLRGVHTAANTDLAVRPTLITTSIPRLAGFIKAFAHKFKGFTNQQKVVLFFCKLICRYLKNHAVVGIMVVYLDKQKS